MEIDLTLNEQPISRVYLADCMDFMKEVPDNFADLAIVDPPYGLNMHEAQGTSLSKPKTWKGHKWDLNRPDKSYFDELFRISVNQIIWGANYFTEYLKSGTKWLSWDKMLYEDQSHFELAWTSFYGAERMYKFSRSNLQGFQNPARFHPTEKPVALYKWLLKNYAKPGNKIFDSHLGSMSSRIACWDGGFDFWGTELDPDYFKDGNKRFERHRRQLDLFNPSPAHHPPEPHTAQSGLF